MTQEFYLILFIVLSLILSYLIGSIPTAKIIASRHGVDITKEGKVVINGSLVVERSMSFLSPLLPLLSASVIPFLSSITSKAENVSLASPDMFSSSPLSSLSLVVRPSSLSSS